MDTRSESQRKDRRILRTKNYLRNAALDLIVERGEFNSIQISEIADKANVARSTFYLHYGDKEELIYDALDHEFNQFLTAIRDRYQKVYAPVNLLFLLCYTREHPRYFQVVLNSVGTTKAFEQTRHIFEKWLTNLIDFSVFETTVPYQLISYHISGTIFNLIKWWLTDGDDHSPEDVEKFGMELIMNGVLKIIGLNSKKELDAIFRQQIENRERGNTGH